VFHYDGVLRLLAGELAIDSRRRQPKAFISHAHYDHMAGHELGLCTPETARLYHLRFGLRPTMAMRYGKPIEWHGLRLTALPAGHCLGSAMLLAEDGELSLLYTGDFKLGTSATSVTATLPRADILIMETTYGDPRYRLPPRDDVVGELVDLVRRTLAAGRIPVIYAYALGKAQEVVRLLTAAGIPVLEHMEVFRVSQVYRQCGVDLGATLLYSPPLADGRAIVAAPRATLRRLPKEKTVRIAVTGWAVHPSTRFRWGVDYALPLSDHAGYDELLMAVEQVAPREIYCTHGPESFVSRLVERGHNAMYLTPQLQRRLF
jgi:Cft2 family RNA processing exonuclease